MSLQALLWDIDGTVAETERDGHRVAFNAAFEHFGLPWRWSVAEYGPLLRIAGGYERLLHDLGQRNQVPAAERAPLAKALHAHKNRAYAAIVREGRLAARPGVLRLMDEAAEAGLSMAVATTTGLGNVEALFECLCGPAWRDRFAALVCAEDAPRKKPDPMAHRLALARLGIAPDAALAIEDSRNGLVAARAAGVPVLVTRSEYFADDDFTEAARVCDDLDGAGAGPRIDVPALRALHAQVRAAQGAGVSDAKRESSGDR